METRVPSQLGKDLHEADSDGHPALGEVWHACEGIGDAWCAGDRSIRVSHHLSSKRLIGFFSEALRIQMESRYYSIDKSDGWYAVGKSLLQQEDIRGTHSSVEITNTKLQFP